MRAVRGMAVHARHHTKGQGKRENVFSWYEWFGAAAAVTFAWHPTVAIQNDIATRYTRRAVNHAIVFTGISVDCARSRRCDDRYRVVASPSRVENGDALSIDLT